MSVDLPLPVLKPADFASDQDVRWCPGCGDYSILAQMKKVCAKLGMDRTKMVFVSGIGCSSRFPYYMNTYGFHTIHGRAPAVSTGVKLTNPDLQVWVITGVGTVSPSTPFGSVDLPLSPISMALGAEAGFVARTSDNDVKHMGEVFAAA